MPRKQRGNVNYKQVIALHREHPDWDSHAIAAVLGCNPGYVRATAQRQGLTISPKPRLVKRSAARTNQRVYRKRGSGDDPLVYFSAKEQLAEVFYEFFDGLFAQRAVFEQQPKLAAEFNSARRKGQSLAGFLLGDPLPARSALAKKNLKES